MFIVNRAFSKSDSASHEHWGSKHNFEHWYRDRTAYFITSRCRGRFPAFAMESAKSVFWQRFEIATAKYGFQPWITSLLDNHYHTIGYLERGSDLPKMMQLLHGGVAKLVNDLLAVEVRTGGVQVAHLNSEGRLLPFWTDSRRQNYFDGCLRGERQLRRAFRYVQLQAVRHGIVRDWREYPHTRAPIELDEALRLAVERNALMKGVPYKRYESAG